MQPLASKLAIATGANSGTGHPLDPRLTTEYCQQLNAADRAVALALSQGRMSRPSHPIEHQ
jgi:hypothetical protein